MAGVMIAMASAAGGWSVLQRPGKTSPVDFTERYPATLSASLSDTGQLIGYEWDSRADDAWELERFEFACGDDFRIELGRSSVVFGHHDTNVLWAAVLPRELGKIVRASDGEGERVSSIWLRFPPQRVGEFFPAADVLGPGDSSKVFEALRIATHKLRSSWHSQGRPAVPELSCVIVDMDTREGPRRFFAADTDQQSVEYFDDFRASESRVRSLGNAEDAEAQRAAEMLEIAE